MNKIICKHKGNRLLLVLIEEQDINGHSTTLICEMVLDADVKVDFASLNGKMIITLSTGMSTLITDGYENEEKQIFAYPPAK